MSNKSNNVLMTKTKVVFTVNDFDVNQKAIFSSNDFNIGSNVCKIIIDTNYKDRAFKAPIVAITLRLNSENNENKVFVRFDYFIYDSNMKIRCHRFCDNFSEISQFCSWSYHSFTKNHFITIKDIIFPNKTLKIGVIITVKSKDVYQCIQRGFGYRNTFNVKEFNDLHIICGTKQFFVSKAVLISYSEVFEKMFTNVMSEQNTNQLIIEDIDGEVFEEFLKFIYFGNSDKLEEFKVELLFIADKYQVLDFKEIFENLMFIEICDLNAIQLLLTFDKYNCIQMLENSIEFISKNLMEIKSKTPKEWKELKERHIELLARITEKMAELIKKGLIGDKAVDESIKCFTFSYIK